MSDFELTFCDDIDVTTDRQTATYVIVRRRGLPVITLAHATHPRYGVRGYTLNPHRQDPVAGKTPLGYQSERFVGGHLDVRIQERMWVDPEVVQPEDIKRPATEWGTLHDLLTFIKPLLKG